MQMTDLHPTDTSQPDNWQVKRFKVLKCLNSYCDRSTIQGLGPLAQSKTLFRRFIWLCLLLTGLFCSVAHILATVQNYQESSVQTVVTFREKPSYFPDVTLCNLQPMSRITAKLGMKQVEQHMLNMWKDFWPIVRVIKKRWSREYINKNRIHILRKMFGAFWTSENTQDMGMNLKSLIILCKYKGRKCSHKDFKLIENYKMWNCYTFQPKDRDITVESRGTTGLDLILFTDSFLYNDTEAETVQEVFNVHDVDLQSLSDSEEFDSSGMRMYIHRKNSYPFTDSKQVNLGIGTSTVVEFNRRHIEMLNKPPMNPCNETKGHVTRQFVTEIFQHLNNTRGTKFRNFTIGVLDYMVEMQQKHIFEECSCYSHKLAFRVDPSHLCYHLGEPENTTQINIFLNRTMCHDTALEKALLQAVHFQRNHLNKQKCEQVHFTVNSYSAPWPNVYDARILIYRYVTSALRNVTVGGEPDNHILTEKIAVLPHILKIRNDTDKSDSTEWSTRHEVIANNFIKVQVRADDPYTRHEYETMPYSLVEAVAETGGILGLYCGVSIITLCELLELIGIIIQRITQKNNHSQ